MCASDMASNYITWRQTLVLSVTVIGICCTVSGGAITWGWAVHTSQPHRGAVEEHIYLRDMTMLDKRLERIENKLDRIFERQKTLISNP